MHLTPFYLYLMTLNNHQKTKIISEQLYTSVVTGDYENAATMTEMLDKSNGTIVKDVVDKLFDNNIDNIVQFAYKLWSCGGKDVITNHFPVSFRLMFNENHLKLVNNKYGLALKLAVDTLQDERLVWGDASDNSSNTVTWKLIPIWESDRVYFKIVNVDHSQFMKLAVAESEDGKREVWGANSAYTNRHQWYLRPVKYYGEFLFYIFNREYNQALKLDWNEDSVGDRLAWGHRGYVEDPEEFGWSILPV